MSDHIRLAYERDALRARVEELEADNERLRKVEAAAKTFVAAAYQAGALEAFDELRASLGDL
jgi:hypothetical protein